MPDLNLQRISVAALAVADARGAGGFTMRAVAKELGVSPMALYHHVPDKAGLVELLANHVIASFPLPLPTGNWRDDLLEMCRWMRTMTLAHPAVGRLRSEHSVVTPRIFPIAERWMSLWQQSGLRLDDATLAAAASGRALVGFVDQVMVTADEEMPDESLLAAFPNARFAFNSEHDADAEFELMIHGLIAGIYGQFAEAVVASTSEGRPT